MPSLEGARRPVDGLTAQQLHEYDEQGYLVLERFFQQAELAHWQTRFLDIVEGRVQPAPGMLVMRDVMIAKGVVSAKGAYAIAKLQDLEEDPQLFRYSQHERLLDTVACLIGNDIRSVHSMLVNKPPGVDGRHPLHQDQFFFPFGPPELIVAAWTALGECKRENGCLFVVPGSHRVGLLPHSMPDWPIVNGKYFGVTDIDGLREGVHLEMASGDLLLFHPLLVHGSGRNRTNGFRRALCTHYASSNCVDSGSSQPLGERRYRHLRGRPVKGISA